MYQEKTSGKSLANLTKQNNIKYTELNSHDLVVIDTGGIDKYHSNYYTIMYNKKCKKIPKG